MESRKTFLSKEASIKNNNNNNNLLLHIHICTIVLTRKVAATLIEGGSGIDKILIYIIFI